MAARGLRYLVSWLLLATLLPAAGQPAAVYASGAAPAATQAAPLRLPSLAGDWWVEVQAGIQAAEYQLTPVTENLLSAYQAPNRAQGLRTYFLPDSVRIVPRGWAGAGAPAWQLRLALVAGGSAGLAPADNSVTYRRPDGVAEWYRNEPRGLVQGFELAAVADGQPAVTLAISTDLTPILAADGQAVHFADAAGAAVLRYADLAAADAAGRRLPAHLALAPAGGAPEAAVLQLHVDATDAAFPLVVTARVTSPVAAGALAGLSPAPAWSVLGDQDYADFGFSAATAGDVNGDGFTDVVVGAPYYDHGQGNEGRAFLYYGSAAGLSGSYGWSAEGNQVSAIFGFSVATAGDVNGDGYADVIVGALSYGSGQVYGGGAFVFHGAAGGLNSSPGWTAASDQASANFGFAVAPAGDVNGDGYADVIIGAPDYDNGQTDEGRAYLFCGSVAGLSAGPGWTAEGNQAGAGFGASVATAGDVNGDGFADIVVAAPDYDNGQTDEGMAYVYYGGAGGLGPAPGWTAEGDQSWAAYGESVATAGDVNGDGYADVVVGARYYDNGQTDEGRGFVYYGAAGGLSPSPGWTAEGNQAEARFGDSVSSAGDVNGDGCADVIVAASAYDGGQADEGKAYVYYGATGGLSSVAGWSAESNQAYAYLGYSVATAGDVNGDGYADVIVGAPYYMSTQPGQGQAYVYHGASGALGASPAWSAEGSQAGADFGCSVAAAGDVNGDGYGDVIVGAPSYDNGQVGEGRAYVYHGSGHGLGLAPAWSAEGNQPAAQFGWAVATAGDVDGDGYADVIVGALQYDNGQTDEGRAYVYRGSPAGLSGAPAWTAESNQAQAYFGYAVAAAGDVNGDGYADVIVAAPYYDNGEPDEGRAYLYYGSPDGLSLADGWTAERNQADARFGWSVATAGDVDGDGYADVIVGAPFSDRGETDEGQVFLYRGGAAGLSARAGWTAESDQAEANFGVAVATAGDVDGDGYADVIVGAFRYDHGQTDEGQVFVYRGSASGLSASAAWTAEGNQADAQLGYSAATAGDVNGDGYADVIAGAFRYDNGQTDEGRAYLYLGAANGLSGSAIWTLESNQAAAQLGVSVATAGDVNGDGYADLIVGAFGYDGGQADEGMAQVYYGNTGAVTVLPRQRRGDNAAPIAPGGKSERLDGFRLALFSRTPFGRGPVKLEWEVKPLGELFDGQGIGSSPSWTDTGVSGASLHRVVTGLAPRTPYHWRVRLRYHPAVSPFQQYSRWITVPWNGWNETDLRTGGLATWLPLVLR